MIWSLLCITVVLADFIGWRDSNTVNAPFWEWVSIERQQCIASHLGQFMFPLVAVIHLSDIASLYREKLQRHAPCRILRMSVNGGSMSLSMAFWVIYVPIDCRYPFIKYWQPLLAKTSATCSLPHPENERQQSVNSCICCTFGNQGIERIFAFITELLTAMIGKSTIYQTYNTDSKSIDIATCKACKTILLVVNNAILIRYY